MTLGRQQWWLKWLNLCRSHRRPQLSSRCLASARFWPAVAGIDGMGMCAPSRISFSISSKRSGLFSVRNNACFPLQSHCWSGRFHCPMCCTLEFPSSLCSQNSWDISVLYLLFALTWKLCVLWQLHIVFLFWLSFFMLDLLLLLLIAFSIKSKYFVGSFLVSLA